LRKQPLSNRLKSWFAHHHPSGFLLAAQLLLLILYAVFDDLSAQWELLNAVSGLILLLIVWVIRHSPGVDWIAWLLAIPIFLLSVSSAFFDNQLMLVLSSILATILYFYAAGGLIIYMLEDTKVTTDELFAAGATFTLLAWGFAHAYFVCSELIPGSIINSSNPGQTLKFIELLFLSFTNLSATGLGDILPILPAARVIAMLEQFSGVGYLTLVVSRLIGLTTNFQTKRRR
jgi:hypothetical protein